MDRRRPRRWLRLGYASAVYVYAAVFIPYFLWFAGGRAEAPARAAFSAIAGAHPLAVDAMLLALFAVPHSVMARRSFKRWLGRAMPDLVRSVYVLCTCAALSALVALWVPAPEPIWTLTHPVTRALATAAFAGGVMLAYAAALSLGHADLLGLAPAWRAFRGLPERPAVLHVRGPYGLVRHPLMLALLLVFWSAPSMTSDRLLFAGALSVYAALGTWLEERDLLALHGADFAGYRRRVPVLVPETTHRRRHARPTAPHTTPDEPPVEISPSIVEFDFAAEHEVFWYDLSVLKTLVLDAYTVVACEIERFAIGCIHAALPRVEDPGLARRASTLIAQETRHATQHERSVRVLVAQGFEVAPLRCALAGLRVHALEPLLRLALGPAFGLAMAAGVEHWTAFVAEVHLEGDAGRSPDSEMKRLLAWHSVEELEHRAVAFDLLRALSRSEALRVTGFVAASLVVAVSWAMGAAILLAQVRRLSPRAVFGEAARYLFTRERLLVRGARSFVAYLRPGYHPDGRGPSHLLARGPVLDVTTVREGVR